MEYIWRGLSESAHQVIQLVPCGEKRNFDYSPILRILNFGEKKQSKHKNKNMAIEVACITSPLEFMCCDAIKELDIIFLFGNSHQLQNK